MPALSALCDNTKMASPIAAEIESVTRYLEEIRADLYGRVLPFWLAHSVDNERGGFFNCLDEDGAVFDTHKHIWLQGRQCWMFANIANTLTDAQLDELAHKYDQKLPTTCDSGKSKVVVQPLQLTRANLISAARAGVQFLRDHAVNKADGTIYFALDRDGKPALMQRKIFSATFMIMALGEVGKATGEAELQAEAVALLDRVLGWVDGGSGSLGKEGLEGAPQLSPLNVPMILLNVILELMRCLPGLLTTTSEDGAASASTMTEAGRSFYTSRREWCSAEILRHAHADRRVVMENVRPDGSIDASCPEGRLINPGHAIEAGWFLLEYAQLTGDAALATRAIEIIGWSWELGWDNNDEDLDSGGGGGGGFIYFKDLEGFSPTQLEWPMKLWWPMNETMIATAMAYEHTLDPSHLSRFTQASDWAFSHLCDKKKGEWFGYCDRKGEVTHRFKGGPYKGCFHVPRSLFMCEALLVKALAKLEQKQQRG